MSQPTYEHPVASPVTAGQGTEPCTSCGAPLAGDQRYCMYCGTRRPTARLEFLDVLAGEPGGAGYAPAVAPSSVAAPPRGVDGWLRGNAPALALAAVLLTTLLIGLLVGHWATRSTVAATPTPAPQVIRITGGGQAAAPAAPTTTSTPAATGGGSAATPSKKAAPAAKSTSAKGAADVKALSKKQLDKAVKKGKPITTGSGTPPPKDDKPAGGGSDFQTIG
jgi:hypothetical protein